MEAIMQSKTGARARRIISWLRETWAEMEYAQRRMIELNMVVPPPRVSADHSGVDELEAIYSLPPRAPDHHLE